MKTKALFIKIVAMAVFMMAMGFLVTNSTRSYAQEAGTSVQGTETPATETPVQVDAVQAEQIAALTGPGEALTGHGQAVKDNTPSKRFRYAVSSKTSARPQASIPSSTTQSPR
jgi:hypothetical protein